MKKNKFQFRDVLWLLILIFLVPTLGSAEAKRRGVKLSHIFVALALLALIARIIWVATH